MFTIAPVRTDTVARAHLHCTRVDSLFTLVVPHRAKFDLRAKELERE
jgi:hypothetical protein